MFEPYLMGQYQYPWQGMPPTPNWQPQTPQVAQGQQGIQGIRFVDGIEEAKNCTVPLGSKVLLMDKEKDMFYLKETDMAGVSTVSEFEFKKVEAEAPQEYITRQEFEQFSAQLSAQLKEQYESVIQRAGQFQQPVKPSLGSTQQQSPLSQMSHLMEFIKTTSPEQAKAQVEQLIKELGITQQEFDAVKRQASEMAKVLGIK